MKSHLWTPLEIDRLLELRGSGYSCSEVAAMLQVPEATVRNKLLAMGYTTRRISAVSEEKMNPSLSQSRMIFPSPSVAEKATALVEKQLRRQRERSELAEAKQMILEERIFETLRRHWEISPPIINVPPVQSSSSSLPPASSAVIILSDAHIGKTVDPAEVPLPRVYNPVVAVERVAYLEKVISATLQAHPVKQLYIIFAGDMVEGHLGHALQDNLTPPIALQFDLALSLFAQFVLRVAAHAPATHVYNVVGNHGRMLGERRMPSTGRWSNFDGLLYRAISAWLQAAGANHIHCDRSICSRLRINTPHHVLQVQHGDEIRGGTFGATGLTREYQHSAMRSFQQGEAPPDLLILGDKHISAQIPVGSAQCIYNGSFVGMDAYGMGFPPSRPSQTMLYLHRGRQETHVIHLDDLPPDLDIPYHFPTDLQRFLNPYRHDH